MIREGRSVIPKPGMATIGSGGSAEYKRELLRRLWRLLQDATGAPDDEIVIGIQEVPPSQAIEMAQIMPDVAGQ